MQTEAQLRRTAFIEQAQPAHGFLDPLQIEKAINELRCSPRIQRPVILLEAQHAAIGVVGLAVAHQTADHQQAQLAQTRRINRKAERFAEMVAEIFSWLNAKVVLPPVVLPDVTASLDQPASIEQAATACRRAWG